jgi:rhamnogalacturonan acetylesterase
MKSPILFPFLLLFTSVFSAPQSSPRDSTHDNFHSSSAHPIPTIFLAGDSTEAPDGGHNGTEGWGQYLQYSFDPSTAFVNNSAFAGRSARSFTREGRFQAIANLVKPGDWVIIEFGHNDGGSPYPASSDIGRADCPGAGNRNPLILRTISLIATTGNETCPTVYACVFTYLCKGKI